MKANVLLVADDDKLNTKVAEAARKTRHGIRNASSSRNTFEILGLRLDDVDLAIVDVDPSLHSVAILEALNYSEAPPPVIALTEVDEAEAAPILRRHGAAACLKKPFGVDELAALMQKVCACGCRNRPLSCDRWGHVRASAIRNSPCELTSNPNQKTFPDCRGMFDPLKGDAKMNATSSEQIKVSRSRRRPACFGSRHRYHNPMLVLNMSIFNSETGWETIFNPRPSHENVWC